VVGPLEGSMTLAALRQMLSEKTKILAKKQQMLAGFPPKELRSASKTTLQELGLSSGVSIVVREGPEIADHDSALSNKPDENKSDNKVSESKFPPLQPLVRRVIDHDNSCLFNAVGYVLDNRNRQAQELLRAICASVIGDNKDQYTEGFLGKKNDDYVVYILNPEKWGGAIELAILADNYKAEIAAVEIQSATVYYFGQGKGYKQRAYLMYNGIHYDSLVWNKDGEKGDDKNDVTIFDVSDDRVKAQAIAMAKELQKQKQFTNVNSFSLKCDDCSKAFVGAVDATEHAKSTGHRNFSEYK